MVMDEKLAEFQINIIKVQRLKDGEIEPLRCEVCDYCADTEEAKTKALLDHNFDSWEEMQDYYGEEEMYCTEWEIYDEFYTDNELYFTLNESLLWEQHPLP